MAGTNPAIRHHPSWHEVRDSYLADPEVLASYHAQQRAADRLENLPAAWEPVLGNNT